MLRKITIIAMAAVTTAMVFAKPGTWGKEEAAGDAKEIKSSAVQFNHWLKDFRDAYEQRDGEKMGDLIKKIEDKQKNMPDMPRIEKWLTDVKETYDAQDVQKMDRLLDNAEEIHDRIRERFDADRDMPNEGGREHFGRNDRPAFNDEQQARGDDNFGRGGRPFAGPRGRGGDNFAAEDIGPMDEMDRPQNRRHQQDDFGRNEQNNDRPGRFDNHDGVPMGGEFEGPRVMDRAESRPPMRMGMEQEGFAPRVAPRNAARSDKMGLRPYGQADRLDAPRFDDRPARMDRPERPMMRGGYGNRGFAPQRPNFDDMSGSQDRPFQPQMRRQFRERFEDRDSSRQPSQDRAVPEDFWR